MIKTKITFLEIVNRVLVCFLVSVILLSCSQEKVQECLLKNDAVIIVFDFDKESTEIQEDEVKGNPLISILRKETSDPNLRINLGQVYQADKIKMSRDEILNCQVLFDAEMDYKSWFLLDYDHYYLVEKDEFEQIKEKKIMLVEYLVHASGLE